MHYPHSIAVSPSASNEEECHAKSGAVLGWRQAPSTHLNFTSPKYLQTVFENCICPNWKVYLSNCKIYFYKLQNLFVQKTLQSRDGRKHCHSISIFHYYCVFSLQTCICPSPIQWGRMSCKQCCSLGTEASTVGASQFSITVPRAPLFARYRMAVHCSGAEYWKFLRAVMKFPHKYLWYFIQILLYSTQILC